MTIRFDKGTYPPSLVGKFNKDGFLLLEVGYELPVIFIWDLELYLLLSDPNQVQGLKFKFYNSFDIDHVHRSDELTKDQVQDFRFNFYKGFKQGYDYQFFESELRHRIFPLEFNDVNKKEHSIRMHSDIFPHQLRFWAFGFAGTKEYFFELGQIHGLYSILRDIVDKHGWTLELETAKSKEQLYWEKVESQLANLKSLFEKNLDNSSAKEKLIDLEINSYQTLLMGEVGVPAGMMENGTVEVGTLTLRVDELREIRRLSHQLIVKGQRDFSITTDPDNPVRSGVGDAFHIKVEAFKKYLDWLPTKRIDSLGNRPKVLKSKSILTLFDVWQTNKHGTKKEYNEFITMLKQPNTFIDSPFVTEINGQLHWQKVPNKGWVRYLAAFIFTCFQKKWIANSYSAPELKRILTNTFNVDFDEKPFRQLIANPPHSKYLQPFKTIKANL